MTRSTPTPNRRAHPATVSPFSPIATTTRAALTRASRARSSPRSRTRRTSASTAAAITSSS
ncbi:hypothetical protein ABZ864_47680 [Streptomyces sp. NPDC047082]|uniref:hypothetical protein n=1 Tax=Streptomyces sp. NPDC047082 TaxID=3155259 RepID=UPI0033E0BE1A